MRLSMNYGFSEKELAAFIGTKPRTLQRWRTTGEGPAFTRIGPRRILYRADAVQSWLNEREHKHRAAELVGVSASKLTAK
jgi:phage terminase Nu1 subunit (DNA packaging protein)